MPSSRWVLALLSCGACGFTHGAAGQTGDGSLAIDDARDAAPDAPPDARACFGSGLVSTASPPAT
jgi:hypothetical protein